MEGVPCWAEDGLPFLRQGFDLAELPVAAAEDAEGAGVDFHKLELEDYVQFSPVGHDVLLDVFHVVRAAAFADIE